MISLQNISKSYPSARGNVNALVNLTVEFRTGTITAVFGANGSGKSTLMGLLSGLTTPDSGTISFQPPAPRIGMVFQDFRNSLLPWLSLQENILRPTVWQGRSRNDAKDRLRELLTGFSINLPLERYPHEVSGGQAQVACLMRALTVEPQILLLDEPTSALDFTLQWQTILELERFWNKEGTTIILVSHDPEQALLIADRIVFFGPRSGQRPEILEVELPRPRTFAMTGTEPFLRLRGQMLSSFAAISQQK